ncbi:hypothetical protein [Alcaligenes faecalis]|uniref:hypothetical protein n=1 Tax=Alcaligenes faecalis TaxID=511 RepID=UPI001C9A33D7|nr:hypothetical protein [Alcaligenes faecalis]MBY6310427.1 hypothetical protein [Alcaligenes faecalis]MBY6315912.1 hypothetical protein [Alcaligenes faecalis]MBY6390881.1 hypothetical protein [Alcaligenes faecalis]
MKQDDCEARILIALAVGVGFGVLIGAALLAAFYPLFQSKEWAAWVQAIGSVAAIIGTYLISRVQLKAEIEKEKNIANKIKIEKINIQNGYISMTKEIFEWIHRESKCEDINDNRNLECVRENILSRWLEDDRDKAEIILQSLKDINLHEVEFGRRRDSFLHCRLKLDQLCKMINGLMCEVELEDKCLRKIIKDIYYVSGTLHGWHDAFLQSRD